MEQNVFEKIEELLEKKDEAALRKELLSLNSFEISKIINQIFRGKRKLFILLPPEIQGETILFLSRKTKKTIISRLGNLTIARLLHFIEDDSDIVDILQFFPEKRRSEILDKIQIARRPLIEKLLKYAPDIAGGIMDYNFILVGKESSFEEIRQKMEEHERSFKKFPVVIIEDDNKKIIGYLPFQKLIFAPQNFNAKKFSRRITLVNDDEKDVELIKYIEGGEQILGVLNGNGDFAGIIKIEDLAKISLKETTENIYGFAGVRREEDVFDSPLTSIKLRSGWLVINLFTAFLAAGVVSMFQGTISKFVLLAAYMPIVAGMGGNAGTQTLAVTVRAIALGNINFKSGFPILKKEILTSLGNGFIIGLVASVAALVFNANIFLGLILISALMINLVVAGFFGVVIPLTLNFFKIDPALASSVFITTATDVFGFLTFLGLAKIFLV